jgi:hypothetical protein
MMTFFSPAEVGNDPSIVMAGLVPAIHAFASERQDVDARDKRGHDES